MAQFLLLTEDSYSPVEVGRFSHYLQGLGYIQTAVGLEISSINSMYQFKWGPLLTYLLNAVPSILTLRYIGLHHKITESYMRNFQPAKIDR